MSEIIYITSSEHTWLLAASKCGGARTPLGANFEMIQSESLVRTSKGMVVPEEL